MTLGPYELATAAPARRALAERLPADVATAAADLITAPLLAAPRRMAKPLRDELTGVFAARLGRDWRVLYEIDEGRRLVVVLDIQHRAVAYRRR